MPKLLERVGTKVNEGSITGLFSILIEADDINDPIGDAVRSIIDGHIMLSRDLAARNQYPAIDILNSTSRLMKEIVTVIHDNMAGRFRDLLATYKQNEDLINIGAYKKGSNRKIDEAINKFDTINNFLKQSISERFDFNDILEALKKVLS
jgi:flagellum-specific ATP synthase